LASNQTPRRYIDQAKMSRGTGVFLQATASGENRVVFEQNLAYDACVALGKEYLAFKWVLFSIASYSKVVDSRCKLAGERCSKSCDADGCLCDTEREVCVDVSGNSQLPPNTGGSESGDESYGPVMVDIRDRYSIG
jgi:hypothetical protein